VRPRRHNWPPAADPLEFWALDTINEVNRRMKHGEVAGSAVISPQIQ